MTTYYVGPGGNDASAGTSWGARKLTLTGAEDIPVAANDTVYVGPGVYRESLTLDVSGTSSNPITYIGDVTGQNTDGVGGIVRITGSDNDQTATRSSCINGTTARNYRTFRGFMLGEGTGAPIYNNGGTNWIIEDCVVQSGANAAAILVSAATQAANTIRRCMIYPNSAGSAAISFTHSSVVDNTGHLVENCKIFPGRGAGGVTATRIGGITVKNSAFYGGLYGVNVNVALNTGQVITVYDCIFDGINTPLAATTTAEFTEDYNSLYAYATARTNVTAGSNSNTYPPIFQPPLLFAGLKLPWCFGDLSEWSQIRAIAGTSEATDDFFGITRTTTSAKKSWGPVQYGQEDRETSTVDAGSVSLKLSDAGYRQFIIPVGNVSTTFTVKVYREADYAGTNPQIIIKQPGVADNTTTDAGSASAWNTLSVTLTPAASPDYVIVELKSNNTATTGNYDVFFDTFTAAAALDPNGMEYWIADRMPLPQLAETEVAGGGLLTHPGMAGGING